MTRTQRWILAIAATALAAVLAPVDPAYADAITKVRGVVTDFQGKPMVKAKIWFEAVDVKKRVGPLTTGKDGKFVIASLDISVAKKWHVMPDLPGYKTVKVHYEIIDSEKADRGSGDVVMGSKQEYPDLMFALVGDEGRNVVDIVVAKEADFVAAVQGERKKKEGGDATASAGAPAGAPGGVPGAPGTPGAPDAPKAGTEGLKKAKELADAGHHAEAIEGYKAYLVKDPTGNANVYYYLGKSLFETHDDAGAEQAFRKGLELKPDMKGAHFFLGNIKLRGEQYADAAAEFEQESNLTPDNDSVWFNLGTAWSKAGQDEKAIAAFEKVGAINPTRSDAYMQMADIYERKNDRAKAEEMYQKVIALDPTNAARSFYNMGVHAWNESKDKEAAQAFRKSVEIDPSYAPAHKELARVLTKLQDFQGAVQHYQEYLKLNPQAPDAKEIRDTIALLKG
ncbi:MAG TPA: tetratricopeptide repeat protein [Candidatus Polarisedimenticolia bacterium]|nr:tetratricopeptide repeat protein [Candidatus Polarisedimenticolia bacterium]